MVELLAKFANEGIEARIHTVKHGMMVIKLIRGDNQTYQFADLKELIQSNTPDDDLTELLSCVYDELKEFEAKQHDL